MSEKSPKSTNETSLPQEVLLSVRASEEKLAEDLVILDLSELTSFTDYFIVMHGNSTKQNVALYENIEKELKKGKVRPLSVEGRTNAEWILMDYGYFVIHIFTKDTREYYSLEKLWGDAPRVGY
jgi:ribosome-associated protein